MAAFIVISTSNQLHFLVDGICECCPQNSAVDTFVSTGKIIQEEDSLKYEYLMPDGKVDEKSKSFRDLVANQLASFRKIRGASKDEMVDVFLLENPLTQENLELSNRWLEDLSKVNGKGKGLVTSFRLFRVLFTYDLNAPCEVCKQVDVKILKKMLEEHRDRIAENMVGKDDNFDQYLFYIDNQNCSDQALFLSDDDQKLKLPRFLADFMMLVSNQNDAYGVFNAITQKVDPTKCFAVGYAESMYYYPDVKRYFELADERDLLKEMLNSDDETEGKLMHDEECMDTRRYPFGLLKRKGRLSIYEDIPFDKDINGYPNSADKSIDDAVIALEDYLLGERKKEEEDFQNSKEVTDLKNEIIQQNLELKQLEGKVKQTNEEGQLVEQNLVKKMKDEIQQKQCQLERMIQEFEPDCPNFINRRKISIQYSRGSDIEKKIADYRKLVKFVVSDKFQSFVDQESKKQAFCDNSQEKEVLNTDEHHLDEHPGCLFSLFNWRKKRHNISQATSSMVESDLNDRSKDIEASIDAVANLLRKKNKYAAFKSTIIELENRKKVLEKDTDEFKLTEHSNSYFPLIDLNKLKKEQERTFPERLKIVKGKWNDNRETVTVQLIDMFKKESNEWTDNKYLFVDWQQPSSFIRMLTQDELAKVCNELEKKSAPFANYNITLEQQDEIPVKHLYSDRSNFCEEIKEIEDDLKNGSEILTYESAHIASKICLMQFLPLSEHIIDNLVDLHTENEISDELPILPTIQKTNEGVLNKDNEDEPSDEFWGKKM